MDPFRPSPRGIPLDEAAAYFISLKKLAGFDVEPKDDVEAPEPAAEEKTAADKSDAEQVEVGRQRAIANLSSGFTSDSHTRGERLGDLIGRLGGAGAGAFAGSALAKELGPGGQVAARLGGAALGQHVGARAGKAVGQEVDGYVFRNKQWKEPEKTASAADALAALSKAPKVGPSGKEVPFGGVPAEPSKDAVQAGAEALSDLSSRFKAAAIAAGIPVKEAAPLEGPGPDFAQEEAMSSAQVENELSFYRERFQQAAQELNVLQQQNAELQAQVDQTAEQQQATLDQATVMQQQAMQNAQAAHQAASQAMQETMQAQQEALATKQESMAVRDHLQGIKQILVDVASHIPDVGGVPTTPSAPADPMAQDPAAAQAPPGGPEAAPAAAEPQGAPPPAEAAPPAPGGQAPVGPPGGDGKLSIKVGNQLLGALGGAAVGAAGTAIETRRPLDGLKAKVQKLEQKEQAGEGSFLNAVNLAQSKFQLGLREAAQAHPGMATAAGGLLGARAGLAAVPALKALAE